MMSQYRSHTLLCPSNLCPGIFNQPGITAAPQICTGWSRSKHKEMNVWLWQGSEQLHRCYSNVGFIRYYQGDSSILVMIHPWSMRLNNSIFQWYPQRSPSLSAHTPQDWNSGLSSPALLWGPPARWYCTGSPDSPTTMTNNSLAILQNILDPINNLCRRKCGRDIFLFADGALKHTDFKEQISGCA